MGSFFAATCGEFLFSCVSCSLFNWSHFREGTGLGSEVGMLFQVFCVNAIYNCTLSVVLVSLGLWLRNLKWSMVVILAIVMTSYVLGKFFPAMTPFLVGTYSMANRLRICDNCYGVDGWIAVTILLLLAGIAYFVGIIGAKKFFIE